MIIGTTKLLAKEPAIGHGKPDAALGEDGADDMVVPGVAPARALGGFDAGERAVHVELIGDGALRALGEEGPPR